MGQRTLKRRRLRLRLDRGTRRRLKGFLPYLLPLVVLAAYAADRTDITPICARQPIGERVIEIRRIVDGDTLVDDCGERIRVLGIDTPEMNTPWGPRASEFTRAWLTPATAPVTLRICPEDDRDRYGRLLARVFRQDGADLSHDLLVAGMAWTLPIPPCGEHELRPDKTALDAAVAAGEGLWAETPTSATPAAEAVRRGGYIFVADIVKQVNRTKEHVDLVLGETGALAVRVKKKRDKIFAAGGIDLDLLTGRIVRTQGKLYWPKSGKPRLYVDYPEYLEVQPHY